MLLDKIRDLCAEKGITISGLESALDFGNGTIRGWAAAEPRAYKLKSVADYLGVSVDDLLSEDDGSISETLRPVDL